MVSCSSSASVPAALAPAVSFVRSLPAGSRVAVLGSRAWGSSPSAPASLVRSLVAALPAGSVVVSGGASGADALAVSAARSRGLSVSVFPAAWSSLGRGAGVARSAALLRSVSCAVVFSCCGSRGSAASVALAKKMGVPVFVVSCSCAAASGVSAPSLWG